MNDFQRKFILEKENKKEKKKIQKSTKKTRPIKKQNWKSNIKIEQVKNFTGIKSGWWKKKCNSVSVLMLKL